ncbi:MAG: rhomboid family intramembrane serine protease [Myxococcaceae bacterium]
MIPISDDNPTLRTPLLTYALLLGLAAVWVLVQGAGFGMALPFSVCRYGLVPGELTGLAVLGAGVPASNTMACVVDGNAINLLTPITSMFMHGSWIHLLGNCLFLWVFGNNVEDSMGKFRFVVFYLICGLAAAATQVVMDPSSRVPMVGASGAISGVMGAYLILYPRVRVRMLFIIVIFIKIIPLPAWLVLLWWFGLQLLGGLPALSGLQSDAGVAFGAHIGGFVAGVILVKLFEDKSLVAERTKLRHRFHPYAP